MKSVTVTKMLMLMAMKKLFNSTEIPPLIVLSYFVFVLSLSLSLSLLSLSLSLSLTLKVLYRCR